MPESPEPQNAEPSPEPSVESPRAAFSFAWGLTAVLLVAFMLFGGLVQALHIPYGIWFTELFLFLGLTWMALRLTHRHPLHYPGLGVPPPSALWLGFLAGTFNFLAVVLPLQFLAQAAFKAAGADELLEVFRGSRIFERQRPQDLAVIVAGVTLAAPLCEEYFFRGVLLRGSVAAGTRPAAALILTGVVFSVFHLDPVGFLARLELGVLFGFLYLRTGSLWPAVLAHAANNAVSSALFFAATGMAEPGAPETDPPLSTLPLAFLVFGGPLYLTLRWFAAREPLLQTGPALSPGGLRRKELAVWLGGAVLSALVVLAVDGRTVAVNLTDLAVGVRQPEPSDGPEAQQAFEALETTRQAAQRGELPVARYREAREDYRTRFHPPKVSPPVPAPVPTIPSE